MSRSHGNTYITLNLHKTLKHMNHPGPNTKLPICHSEDTQETSTNRTLIKST